MKRINYSNSNPATPGKSDSGYPRFDSPEWEDFKKLQFSGVQFDADAVIGKLMHCRQIGNWPLGTAFLAALLYSEETLLSLSKSDVAKLGSLSVREAMQRVGSELPPSFFSGLLNKVRSGQNLTQDFSNSRSTLKRY